VGGKKALGSEYLGKLGFAGSTAYGRYKKGGKPSDRFGTKNHHDTGGKRKSRDGERSKAGVGENLLAGLLF